MRDLVNLLLSSIIVFGASVAIALAAGTMWRRWRRPFVPSSNAKTRMRTGASIYRCRFVGEGRDGWAFSAPLQRDSYVPIDVGQNVSCEVTTDDGVVVFETRVKARRQDPINGASIVLSPPRQVRTLNRRDSERRSVLGRTEVHVDGQTGQIIDLSAGGAKIKMRRPPVKGARVGLKLPSGESVVADVLEADSGIGGATIRVRFQDPIERTG